MRPIEHWMPPSAAGKDAPVGGLRATYAHAAAHLRCALPCHMPTKRLRLIDCPHTRAFASSRRPTRPERQRPAAYARRLHRNSRLEHVHQPSRMLCATFRRRATSAASCEALLAPPARKSSVFGPSRPPCARYGAHGWPARRAQPRLDGFDGARPLHPARVASGKLWSAPPET